MSRTFYGKIAIVGPSGTGKTYLSKTADKQKIGFINIENKPFGYKGEIFKFTGNPKSWAGFMKNLKDYGENKEIEGIIIDSQTAAFNRLNNEMGKSFVGWDVAKNYNKAVYDYLELLKNIEKDIIVISHDETLKLDDGSKQRRMTVHNKEYEGKLEREYTTVLFSGTRLKDGKPEFFLKTFDPETSAKSAEDLFGNPNPLEIPNDASFIFNKLKEYYA